MINNKLNDSRNSTIVLLLVYLISYLAINVLVQEMITIPKILSNYSLDEETKQSIIDEVGKLEIKLFLFSICVVLLRILVISFILFIGTYLYEYSFKIKQSFINWFSIVVKAQLIIVIYKLIMCCAKCIAKSVTIFDPERSISLLFLYRGDLNCEDNIWIITILTSLNIIEFIYWLFLSFLVSKNTGMNYGKSFKYVTVTYGITYLFYIVVISLFKLFNV